MIYVYLSLVYFAISMIFVVFRRYAWHKSRSIATQSFWDEVVAVPNFIYIIAWPLSFLAFVCAYLPSILADAINNLVLIKKFDAWLHDLAVPPAKEEEVEPLTENDLLISKVDAGPYRSSANPSYAKLLSRVEAEFALLGPRDREKIVAKYCEDCFVNGCAGECLDDEEDEED